MSLLLPVLAISATLRLFAGPPAPPTTVLSGHLDHAPAGDSVRLLYGTGRATAPLGPTGDFKLVVKHLPGPVTAWFGYARQHTSVHIALNDS